MATKKRMKRYDEGGDVEEMKRGIASNFKAEAPETVVAEEKDLSPKNFKDAFAEARKAGDKTFEFKGKKYTTAVAASKAATKTEKAPDVNTAAGRTELNARAGNKASGLRDFVTGPNVNALAKPGTYKTGGKVSSASKRADGCAIRGKTRA